MSEEAGPARPDEADARIDDARARAAHLAATGKRVGYGLFGLAVLVFVAGFATRLTDTMTTVITACLVVGSIVLAPAIVVGYGVKAAEREDRQRPA